MTDLEREVYEVYEYRVESQWAGWWGGYGYESVLQDHLNRAALEGWRLVRTERIWALWFWIIVRPKLLYVFERPQWEDDTMQRGGRIDSPEA